MSGRYISAVTLATGGRTVSSSARYTRREEPSMIVTPTWGPGPRYMRLDRWQVRVLQRWAAEDAARDLDARRAGEVEPSA